MIVYVEAVAIDNFVVDFCLLFLVAKTLRERICKWGIFTASAFGVGAALCSPLLFFDGVLGVIIKFAQALVMCIMLNFGFKRLWLKTALFVLYTFCFGGMLTAVFNYLGVSTVSGMYLGYISSYPLGAIFALLLLFFVLVLGAIKKLFKNKKVKDLCVPVCLKLNGKNMVVTGFCDSGNMLKTREGMPIVMLNQKSLFKWFNLEEQIRLMLSKPPNPNCQSQNVVVGTAVGSDNLLVLKAEKCVMAGKSFDVFVGISKVKNNMFDVILNSCMVVENV